MKRQPWQNRPNWHSPLAGLSPAYFGLVMATGIISLAANMMGHGLLAHALFFLNIVQYVVLWLLYLGRALYYPAICLADLQNHARAPGYLTLVAASGILASQCFIEWQATRAGLLLWALTGVLWLSLTYAILFVLTINKGNKPALAQGINGGWLLFVVACQSVAVTSSLLGVAFAPAFQVTLGLLSFGVWLLGGILYLWLILLIFYRMLFLPFTAADFSPVYWINMGAMAISTLAGALLILNAGKNPALITFLPFIKGLALLYWVTASWWIPLLLLLEIWRYKLNPRLFRYEPGYWGMVFPLGMYSACSWQLGHALGFEMFNQIAQLFLYIALLVWGMVFTGMLTKLRYWRGATTINSGAGHEQ